MDQVKKILNSLSQATRRGWKKFLRRFTKWIDPKLEPYRSHIRPKPTATIITPLISAPAPSPNPSSGPAHDIPTTRAELFQIIGDAPLGVFSKRERDMMLNILDLPNIKVSELMLPKSKIVYVKSEEVLGPLTLDRLYQTGFNHFPVIDPKEKIIGCIHTVHFNNLDIRESSRVLDIIDPGIYYIREDYSLEQTLNAFLRTNCFFFLVTDHYGKIVGMLNFNDFMQHIFGQNPHDEFESDNDRLAVASRKGN